MEDATFVREKIIDMAVHAQRWNIVVFELYRSAELLIKGIIYSFGYEPMQHHKLHNLIEQLSNLLEKSKESLLFNHKILDPSGNCYKIKIIRNSMYLTRQINGLSTILAFTPKMPSAYLTPKLVRTGSAIAVYQDKKIIISATDTSISDNIHYEADFIRKPNEQNLEQLKTIVKNLLSTREQAFYRERHFSQTDGENAIEALHEVFNLVKAFEFCERL